MGGHGLHIYMSKRGALDEEIINVSGRQRMLSQRILLLEDRYLETGDARYRDLLIESTNLFETSHAWLLENAVKQSSRVEAHYFDAGGPQLDARSREFVGLARQAINGDPKFGEDEFSPDKMETLALLGLLDDLNTAVSLFETLANTRARTLETIQWFAVAATIVVLLLEVLLIFYPAHRQMSGMIARLRFQAWHDGMTGLANRARFVQRVQELGKAAPDAPERLLVLALDLDGFKAVNDTLGHPVGDQVLKSAARNIENSVSQAESLEDYIVSRVGGDEFLIAGHVPFGDMDEIALALGSSIIEAVEEPITVTVGEERVDQCMVGVSIGYAICGQSKGDTDTFLGNADIALYESKRRGKGVTTAFQQSMREAAEQRHALMTELKVGLKNLEFEAYFQPRVCLMTGRPAGVEALARWHHPKRGLVGPAEFMDLAEESRQIDALDGQIILGAVETYKALLSEGIDLGGLSLNASAGLLRDTDLCELLESVVAIYDISPNDITLEVRESVLAQGASGNFIKAITNLSEAGFQIAIAGFGAEYSSLANVSQLDISAIKIDTALTSQNKNSNTYKIVQALAAMAKGLNTTLVADGISNADHRDNMRELGVETGQGPFFAQPLAADELRCWFQSRSGTELKLAAGG